MESTELQLGKGEELDKVIEYLIGEWGTNIRVVTPDIKSWFDFKESMEYIKETIGEFPEPVEYISFFRIVMTPDELNIPGAPGLFRIMVAPAGGLELMFQFKFMDQVNPEDEEYVKEQIKKSVHQIPGTSLKIVEGVKVLSTRDLLLKCWEEETTPVSDGFEMGSEIIKE